jgi:hypothetical protein
MLPVDEFGGTVEPSFPFHLLLCTQHLDLLSDSCFIVKERSMFYTEVFRTSFWKIQKSHMCIERSMQINQTLYEMDKETLIVSKVQE